MEKTICNQRENVLNIFSCHRGHPSVQVTDRMPLFLYLGSLCTKPIKNLHFMPSWLMVTRSNSQTAACRTAQKGAADFEPQQPSLSLQLMSDRRVIGLSYKHDRQTQKNCTANLQVRQLEKPLWHTEQLQNFTHVTCPYSSLLHLTRRCLSLSCKLQLATWAQNRPFHSRHFDVSAGKPQV